MEPDQSAPFEAQLPVRRNRSSGVRLGYVPPVLVMGIVLGFIMGWISFESPLSKTGVPLYDEEVVTRLVTGASPAVVEMIVSRRSVPDGGAGFLVDDDGHIATNNHVVDGARWVAVKLSDGRTVDATVLGTSPADDLALVRIDPLEVTGIAPLRLADSDQIKPGQMAIAIGSPFSYLSAVSVGVVSGVGRGGSSSLQRPIPDMIQTDAALNPGNSGGPLLNSDGEVIGINVSIQVAALAASTIHTGIGFAIPSNTLKEILDELKQSAQVRRPWIGISSRTLTREASLSLGLPTESEIYVSLVCEGSPADKAGLNGDRLFTGGGDVILGVDGRPVRSMPDLVSYFNGLSPGDEVTLTVFRDYSTQMVDVTLEEWPRGPEPDSLWSGAPGRPCPPQ